MAERATIFALASGRPPAAIAIIRISGPAAHRAAASLIGDLPEPRAAALRDVRHPDSGDLLDQALVLRFEAPASATGEDVVELHCHGGRAVVDAVLRALAKVNGLREAQPGEFTRRAFENGRIDLTEAEGLADLLAAETEAQRRAALALADGGLRAQISLWEQQVLALAARAERAIDYVEEDDEASDPVLCSDCKSLAAELNDWVARPRVEPLKDGIKIVVAGPPNAGKSSLINAIAGEERAIVTPVPGTTRDSIEVPLALEGIPILLTDTAGLRDTDDPVETIGVARAGALIGAADILLWMGRPADAPDHQHLIRLQGKSDLAPTTAVDEPLLRVSAVTGEGIADLLMEVARVARSLLPGGDAVALNRRQAQHLQIAAEQMTAAGEQSDPVLVAEHLRSARLEFDQLSGRAGVEEVLDQLFSRFCLGK